MLFDERFEQHTITVTVFTRYIKAILENEPGLNNAWVEGEVSNVTRATSGHVYFTVKDQGASLSCVMWRNNAQKLKGAELREGVSIQVHGNISVYEPTGKYQLVVDQIKTTGEGSLYAEFARLKDKLDKEGLFDPSQKRALPLFPLNIGVVTSETGAAYQDILNTLRRRMPMATILLSHATVQGIDAPASIMRALQALDNQPDVDVIILARGGGSMEDLWCFNDENVVRSITATRCPVITGVGHEIDFTLVDFAADMRAPTPTAAAEMASPITIEQLKDTVAGLSQTLTENAAYAIEDKLKTLSTMQQRLALMAPHKQVNTSWQKLDDLSGRLSRAMGHQMSIQRATLDGLHKRLLAHHPSLILKRGFSIVQRAHDGKVVKLVEDVEVGSKLTVMVSDGRFGSTVEKLG